MIAMNEPEHFNEQYRLVMTVHNLNNQHDLVLNELRDLKILINVTNQRIDSLEARVKGFSDSAFENRKDLKNDLKNEATFEEHEIENEEEPAKRVEGECRTCHQIKEIVDDEWDLCYDEWDLCYECLKLGDDIVKDKPQSKKWDELTPGGKQSRIYKINKYIKKHGPKEVYNPDKDPILTGTEDHLSDK